MYYIRNKIIFIIKLIVSFTLLYWIYSTYFKEKEIISSIEFDIKYFCFAILIYIIHYLVLSYRLKTILIQSKNNFQLIKCFHLIMVGQVFNQILPSSIGGDAVKILYLNRANVKLNISTISIVYDRLIGFFSLLIIAFISHFFISDHIKIISESYLTLIFVVLVILIILILIFKNLFLKIKFFSTIIFNFKFFHIILISSIISQLIELYGIYIISKSLNINIDFLYIIAFMPIILLITAVPISIGGWGVRESISIYLFSFLAINEFKIALFSICIGLVVALTSSIGVYFLIAKKFQQ